MGARWSEPNAEQQPQGLTVPAVWVGLEDVPISFANQFIGQMDDRCEVVLSLGQVLAPVLMGTAGAAAGAGSEHPLRPGRADRPSLALHGSHTGAG